MKWVRETSIDPQIARQSTEAATGQDLTELSTRLLGDLRRAIKEAPDKVHLILTAESPTGKNQKNVHEVKGIRR